LECPTQNDEKGYGKQQGKRDFLKILGFVIREIGPDERIFSQVSPVSQTDYNVSHDAQDDNQDNPMKEVQLLTKKV